MLGRGQQLQAAGERALGGLGLLEQPGAGLDPQDAAHGIVDPRRRNRARARLRQRVLVERLPVGRDHEHVEARVDRLRAGLDGAARHLAVRVPIAHREAVEAHALLQRAGDEVAIARRLLAADG